MKINGLPVVDAKTTIELHIRPRDTSLGRKQPENCAAARAAVREVPNCRAARIHRTRSYLKTETKWLRYITGDALRNEIMAFDRGAEFQAGHYTLLAPPPSMREGMSVKRRRSGSSTSRNKMGSSPQKAPRKLHVMQGVRPRKASRGDEN